MFKGIKIPQNLGEIGREEILAAKQTLANQSEQILEAFGDFSKEATKKSQEAAKIISNKFDGDPTQLEDDLTTCVSHSYTLGELVSDANSFVLVFKMLHFCPKNKELSEADRERIVETAIIIPKLLLAKLRNLEKNLERKISVGQSILRYETNRFMRDK